jgi:ElaB/YqjD/DUF883 family membrane-anchored ribosome-binding protein
MNEGTARKLVEDFKILIDDVEELVKATASQAGERIGDLRQRLGKKIEDVRKAAAGSEKTWSQAAEEAKTRTEARLRENTWLAVALAAGIGVILGLLMRRRD